MKLQYLGDARDAFKWDLLHWICTTTSFSKLVYVPLLTRDDPKKANEGRIPHHRFKCQNFIRPFLETLKEEPRSLNRITTLGTANPDKHFPVNVIAPDREICSGDKRCEYWIDFESSKFENSVVFFDPDKGYVPPRRYERKKSLRPEWLGHDELKNLFAQLPDSSVALVYQHRPYRTWTDLFADLTLDLAYVHTAIAVYESNLAFVGMAGNAASGKEITRAMTDYAQRHPDVDVSPLF